jgi:tRNA threonylcarbamoyladenosine biosynthesis protein TsaB
LAIDTATDVASVALGSADRIVDARSMTGARQHAAQIVPLIRTVLEESHVPLEQITRLIVGDGPGSFTGLRIAWAVTKGLAHERELPMVAVPALLGAAHAGAKGRAVPVVACFDALRGQVFAALYRFAPGTVETLVAPGLFEIRELARVAAVPPVLAVGDGAQRYAAEILQWTGKPPVGLEALSPIAASLLTLSSIAAVQRPVDAASEPVYGRPAEAQAKWEARYGRPLQPTPDPTR